jgi:hypothetical protein
MTVEAKLGCKKHPKALADGTNGPSLRAPERLGSFPVGVSSGQSNVSQISVAEIAQLIAGKAATQPNGETVSKLG